MRIVVAGASGFLGGHLRPSLSADGHEITQLVRRPPATPGQARWDPARGELDPKVLSGVDAVINLAGVNIADRRWNDEFRALLRNSRVDSTDTLATALAALPSAERPAVLLNQSAVGYYGDTGDRVVTEESPSGKGFFAELCRAWEAAAAPAERAGVRVVKMRTGLPLDAHGGVFKPFLLQFRVFAGGRMGSGRQYIPWISLPDWLDAVRFLLAREDIAGPVNVVGPDPVPNAEFAAVLGRLLRRPAFWRIPGFAMRVAIGELSDEGALVSQRVLPKVLTDADFHFRHSTVEAAMREALSR